MLLRWLVHSFAAAVLARFVAPKRAQKLGRQLPLLKAACENWSCFATLVLFTEILERSFFTHPDCFSRLLVLFVTLQAFRLQRMSSFNDQLVEHRIYLLRFARLQLRNDAWADDAVSETLLAALSKPQSFGNRSQLKTWLVGILKHKVIDILRKQVREVSWVGDADDSEGDELTKSVSKPTGTLLTCPANGAIRMKVLSKSSFLRCLTPVSIVCRLRKAGFF